MEIVTPRTKEDVQLEYNKVCCMAGEAQFKMKAVEAELFEINKKLVALHQEYNSFNKPEPEAKANEATV